MTVRYGTIHRVFYIDNDRLCMKEFSNPGTAHKEARNLLGNIRGCPAVEYWKLKDSTDKWQKGIEWNAKIVSMYMEGS